MILDSIILGIVEGITEFLPVSSTGHLILTSRLLGLEQTDFLKSFEIAIQLGAIFSIVFLYWKTFFKDFEALKRIFVAFIPTAVIGLALYKVFKQYFFSDSIVVYSLFIGGIFLIIFELFYKEKEGAENEIREISYKKSFFIGVFQSIAIIPGVSRSAATIIGGLSMGIKRKAIVEFSFLLAVPTMFCATAYDLVKSVPHFAPGDVSSLLIGFIVSFVVALFSVKWLLKYIQKNNFIAFGVYRIVIALLFFIIILK
jgi:undecaprenyl-diphosphatase